MQESSKFFWLIFFIVPVNILKIGKQAGFGREF